MEAGSRGDVVVHFNTVASSFLVFTAESVVILDKSFKTIKHLSAFL